MDTESCGSFCATKKKPKVTTSVVGDFPLHRAGSGLLLGVLAFTSDVGPVLFKSLILFSVSHITSTTANHHPLTTSSNNKLPNEKASLSPFLHRQSAILHTLSRACPPIHMNSEQQTYAATFPVTTPPVHGLSPTFLLGSFLFSSSLFLVYFRPANGVGSSQLSYLL